MALDDLFLGFGVHFVGKDGNGLLILNVQKGCAMIKEERTMRGDPPGVECSLLPSQRHFVGCAVEISIVCCKSISNLLTRVDFVVAHNGE